MYQYRKNGTDYGKIAKWAAIIIIGGGILAIIIGLLMGSLATSAVTNNYRHPNCREKYSSSGCDGTADFTINKYEIIPNGDVNNRDGIVTTEIPNDKETITICNNTDQIIILFGTINICTVKI